MVFSLLEGIFKIIIILKPMCSMWLEYSISGDIVLPSPLIVTLAQLHTIL